MSYIDRVHMREKSRQIGIKIHGITKTLAISNSIHDKFRILILRPLCCLFEMITGFLEGVENFDPVISIMQNKIIDKDQNTRPVIGYYDDMCKTINMNVHDSEKIKDISTSINVVPKELPLLRSVQKSNDNDTGLSENIPSIDKNPALCVKNNQSHKNFDGFKDSGNSGDTKPNKHHIGSVAKRKHPIKLVRRKIDHSN